MKISQITIDNFRCFDHYEIEFAPKATVLFGLNGVGKSSLIAALHKAVSFVFAKDTNKNSEPPLSAGNSQLKVEGFDRRYDFQVDPETGNAFPFISIKANGSFNGQDLDWTMKAPTSSFRLAKSEYKDAFHKFISLAKTTKELPVLAYYSDGFPHVETKSKIDKSISGLRNFGYYQWNLEGACSKIWTERFERAIKASERLERQKLKYEQEGITNAGYHHISFSLNQLLKEIESISDCLKRFTKGDKVLEVETLTLDAYDERLSVVNTRGHSYHFRMLPSGYRRLLYIVLDLAYRSYVLNGNCDSSGIVMIDEIDLHLHPGLEKEVLGRFLNTFPNIQFIVSTHSPLVLTNLSTSEGECVVLSMEKGDTQPRKIGDIYGIDYNSGLEDIMGVEARDVEIANLLDALIYYLSNNHDNQARRVKELLLKKLGGNENRLTSFLEKRRREMGNEVH